jgi:precorrin-8X/cobalt-precorrin-8 methylmutase
MCLRPEQIENRSFEIIKSELREPPDPLIAPVILRVIHTTADFDYAENLKFSARAIDTAVKALRAGTDIVCDTHMVMAGVDKTRLAAFGGDIFCFSKDTDVREAALQNGTTRAHAAVDKAAALGRPIIFAIGNAPTALLRLVELIGQGTVSPVLVIGVPVGFVNAAESKDLLMASKTEFITARGRKGGSNVAAAIVNALLRMAGEGANQ